MNQDQTHVSTSTTNGMLRQSTLWFLVLGIIFTLIGIYVGEPRSIFDKATQICLQCIGIG
ncbi:MAG TPA: CD1871A family CXXC motif-containing protein [Candidatus Ozemobacteraceae bacterium]|nr:CD1871A family CXXC motif-containing protein [Candidatus Ozemobacteraceae bacterium]